MGFGTSTPTAPRPGIGATTRMLGARIASARSLERFGELADLHARRQARSRTVSRPARWCAPDELAVDFLKVRSASMSFSPIGVELATPDVSGIARRRRSVRSSGRWQFL